MAKLQSPPSPRRGVRLPKLHSSTPFQGLFGTLYGDRLPTIVGRKNLLEILNLGNVVDHDVRKLWVLDEKVLMIVFRRIKAFERINPRDDSASEYPGFIQLRYVCLCDPLL